MQFRKTYHGGTKKIGSSDHRIIGPPWWISSNCTITLNRVIEQVHKYIRDQRLLQPGDRVAVAVSGGADSVALLRVLVELRKDLGIVLSVAHFHHGIRGAEADADHQYVRVLAETFGLEFPPGTRFPV